MKVGTGSERAESLVIELASRTAIIDGARIELPPTEFDLLAAFAARPGQVVTHKEIAALAFGEGASVAPHELHWRIWKVRDVIGDSQREHKLIENRRGVGYVLDLPASAVEVVDVSIPTAGKETVIRLEPTEFDDPSETVEAPIPLTETNETRTPERPRRRPSGRVILTAAAISVIALGGSWVAGYKLSQGRDTVPEPRVAQPEQDDSQREEPDRQARRDRDRDGRKGKKTRRDRSNDSAFASGPVTGSGGVVADAPGDTTTSDSSRSDGGTKKDDPPAPPPPQPDAQLYHLFNSENGDHIVTTSSTVANQKQAAGYSASVEGAVFTSSEKNTTAISLDSGTAYVYKVASSAPSGVSVTALYRLSNEGDFFYTSSSAAANEAQAQGWSRSTVGYVVT